MSSHLNMSENTEIINNDIISTDKSNSETDENKELPEAETDENKELPEAETDENKELPEAEIQSSNSVIKNENSVVEKYDNEFNIENSDSEDLEKMILSTGIRVGTPVKTKSMSRYIVRANPEGLYILDISKTLYRIDVAAKFLGRTNIAKVAITSAREYGKKPVEKFCEATGATPILGRFMPGTFTNPSLPKYMEPEIVIVTDPQADQQAVIEATRAGVPVLAISNSDNVISKVDLVIPANNRGRKALATVYWLLAREVMKKQGKIKSDKEMKGTIDDFETKLVEEIV
jgi:small subunit ribosomal protein S2